MRFHVTPPRAITPGLIVAVIALTIPATIAAVAPAQPTTIDSAAFAPVSVAPAARAAATPTDAPSTLTLAVSSRPAFVPTVPLTDLEAVDPRTAVKQADTAVRSRPAPKAHAAATITPPKPKPKPVAKAKSGPTWSGGGGSSAVRSRIVSIALAQVGDRYVSGATGPDAFDCSGLVRYAYNQAGVGGKLGGGHSASAMLAWGRANGLTSRSGGRPGDVAIYGNGSHAAIYIGNGKVVSALNASQGIRVTGLNALGSGFTTFIHTRI